MSTKATSSCCVFVWITSFIFLLIQQCLGEQKDTAGLRLRSWCRWWWRGAVKVKRWFASGPSQCSCVSISISCMLTQLAGGVEWVGKRACIQNSCDRFGKWSEVATRLRVTYLSEEEDAGRVVTEQGSQLPWCCWESRVLTRAVQGRHVACLWGWRHTRGEVELFHRTLPVLKVQRAHSWKKTLLRAINYKDCRAPRKCLGSSRWGWERCTENISVGLSALTAFLHQLLSAAVKKRDLGLWHLSWYSCAVATW